MKNDTISRAAALDAFLTELTKRERKNFLHTWSTVEVKYFVADMLEKLSSAQPRWIPCSERLPEHGGRYLVSVLGGINRRTTVAPYLPRCKAWTMTGRMAYWKVIAWAPLPEPYKEEP